MRHVIVSLLVGAAVLSASAAIGQMPGEAARLTTTEAPEGQRLALARQFVRLVGADEDVLEGMRLVMQSAAEATEQDEDESSSDRIEAYMKLAEPKVREHLPRINEARAQVYARAFSQDELTHLIGFAESPVGKRYLSDMAELETDPLIQAASAGLLHSLQDIGREQCRQRAARRVAAGDAKAKCPLTARSETLSG